MTPTRHWYDGSTWDGQPTSQTTKTYCGKTRTNPDGSINTGATHTYLITCEDCKAEIHRRHSTTPHPDTHPKGTTIKKGKQ